MGRYFYKIYLLNLVISDRNSYIGMCVHGKVFNLNLLKRVFVRFSIKY